MINQIVTGLWHERKSKLYMLVIICLLKCQNSYLYLTTTSQKKQKYRMTKSVTDPREIYLRKYICIHIYGHVLTYILYWRIYTYIYIENDALLRYNLFFHISKIVSFFLFCSCCTSDHTVTKHDVYVTGRQRCWMKHLFPPRLRSNQHALASFQHDSIDT